MNADARTGTSLTLITHGTSKLPSLAVDVDETVVVVTSEATVVAPAPIVKIAATLATVSIVVIVATMAGSVAVDKDVDSAVSSVDVVAALAAAMVPVSPLMTRALSPASGRSNRLPQHHAFYLVIGAHQRPSSTSASTQTHRLVLVKEHNKWNEAQIVLRWRV